MVHCGPGTPKINDKTVPKLRVAKIDVRPLWIELHPYPETGWETKRYENHKTKFKSAFLILNTDASKRKLVVEYKSTSVYCMSN